MKQLASYVRTGLSGSAARVDGNKTSPETCWELSTAHFESDAFVDRQNEGIMQFRWPYPLAPGIGVWGAPNSNHK
jgi:hypothetical protein